MPGREFPVRRRWRRVALWLLGAMLVPIGGCGKKGPPIPPDPKGPIAPHQVRPRQIGGRALVYFGVPSARGPNPSQVPVYAELFRVGYATVNAGVADPQAFDRIGESVNTIIDGLDQPGTVLPLDDQRLAELENAGIGWTLRYAVQTRDQKGRTSPRSIGSDLVMLEYGSEPEAVRGEPSVDGVRLQWQPPTTVPPPAVDSTASVPNDEQVPADVDAPAGTNVERGTDSDASPDAETVNLLSYNIYRHLPGDPVPEQPINLKPVTVVEYLDGNVEIGQTYIYEIRTVLASGSPIREGPPSAPLEAMGVAVADDVEGPYVNHGIFLQSGMWDQISEDGVNIYDPQIHPNAVDPDAFFDQAGVLWLVYGSYSGGIFILELDSGSGLPKPGQGYGKHLMGGNHSRIEGPYVIYSPETDYYYLFVSFGGLGSQDGYNVRVARSRNPDGPYYDAMGTDMADVKSDPNLPLFDDASIEPYAQKLMGSLFFERDASEPGSSSGEGYASPGHNSAFYDDASGRYFIIFHTRFPQMGEFHQVRVHEMHMNADGWPVIAPFRWVPPTFVPWADALRAHVERPYYMPHCRQKMYCWNVETIAFSETPGEYKIINHGKDISGTVKRSDRVTFHSDGAISGEYTGSWQRSWGNHIVIELDDVGLFTGVMSRGWNSVSNQFVVAFSAQSEEGISIWSSKLAD